MYASDFFKLMHPWVVKDGPWVRRFTNARSAAESALACGGIMVDPIGVTHDRQECLRIINERGDNRAN